MGIWNDPNGKHEGKYTICGMCRRDPHWYIRISLPLRIKPNAPHSVGLLLTHLVQHDLQESHLCSRSLCPSLTPPHLRRGRITGADTTPALTAVRTAHPARTIEVATTPAEPDLIHTADTSKSAPLWIQKIADLRRLDRQTQALQMLTAECTPFHDQDGRLRPLHLPRTCISRSWLCRNTSFLSSGRPCWFC